MGVWPNNTHLPFYRDLAPTKHQYDNRHWLLRAEGDRLFVNADVRTGRLLVEVFDAEGRTVPGFEKSACLPLTGGAVRQAVKWRMESSLPQGKPMRLRFHLTNGELYRYSFETNP